MSKHLNQILKQTNCTLLDQVLGLKIEALKYLSIISIFMPHWPPPRMQLDTAREDVAWKEIVPLPNRQSLFVEEKKETSR